MIAVQDNVITRLRDNIYRTYCEVRQAACLRAEKDGVDYSHLRDMPLINANTDQEESQELKDFGLAVRFRHDTASIARTIAQIVTRGDLQLRLFAPSSNVNSNLARRCIDAAAELLSKTLTSHTYQQRLGILRSQLQTGTNIALPGRGDIQGYQLDIKVTLKT